MKEQDRSSLKKYFETGDRPTEDHFVQLIDSFVNKKDDQVTIGEGNNVGVGTTTPKNKLDVGGAGVIGSAYAGSKTAPANSLIVEGKLGIGLASPTNKLDVHGAAAIGKGYTDKKAPDDGLIVQGPVGLGLATPEAPLDVNGDVKARGNLNVDSNLTVGGNLTVQGEMVVKQVEYHEGNVQLGDQPEDTISIFGTLQGKNPSTALVVNSPIQANEGVTTNKDLNVKGKLKVDGNTELGLAGASETPQVRLNAVINSGLNAVTLRSKGKDSNSFGLKVQNSEGTDQLAVRSDGKVGIGTTTPAYTLDINGSLGATELHGDGSKLTNINASEIASGTLDTDLIQADKVSARSESGLRLTNKSDNGLMINDNGRIGLGIDDPSSKLHIYDLSVKATDALNRSSNYHLLIQGSSEKNKGFGIAFGTAGFVGASILHIDKGTASKGDLAFYTKQAEEDEAPVEVLRLDSQGNAGIGLTNPSEKLEVNGNVKAEKFIGDGSNLQNLDAATIKSGMIDPERLPDLESGKISGIIDATNLPETYPLKVLKAKDGDGLKLNDQNNNGIYIRDGGNVGIGVATPNEKLEVQGKVLAKSFEGAGTDLKKLNASELQSGTVPADRLPDIEATKITGVLPGKLLPDSIQAQQLIAKDSNGLKVSGQNGEGIFLDRWGRVGVHIENPDTALHVHGEVKATKFLLEDGTEVGSGSGESVWKEDGNGNIAFSKGLVNINSRATEYQLEVGAEYDGLRSIVDAADKTKRAIYGYATGTGISNTAVHANANSGTENIGVYAVGADGKNAYGIYCTAHSASKNHALYAEGDITHTGIINSASDKRLKKDIKGLEPSLKRLLQLKGKSFVYKDASNNTRELGLIAQEVEKFFPEVVGTFVKPQISNQDNPGKKSSKSLEEFKSVKYTSFIPILIESIKEQNQLIKDLTTRIEKLENQ